MTSFENQYLTSNYTAATGVALDTVKAHQKPQAITLFAFAYSPLAQRAWVALEYLGIPYKYFDQKNKPKEFFEVSPKGLVPAIIIHSKDSTRSLTESAVIMEYLEELAATTTGRSLLPPPSDPYARALVRLIADHATRNGRGFYSLLTADSKEVQAAGRESFLGLLRGVGDLFERIEKELGVGHRALGLWSEAGELGWVDVFIGPWLFRAANVLRHYHGFEFPSAEESKVTRWAQRVIKDKHFAATNSEEQLYLDSYKSYIKLVQ